MNETLKLGLILLSITVVCATILAFSNEITSVKIAEADKLANETARIEILSVADDFEKLDENKMEEIEKNFEDVLEIYEGFSGDDLVGYTVKIKTKGYGGDIELMTGISEEGKVTGVEILNHDETPGLGANIDKDYFKDSFKNKTTNNQLVPVAEPSEDDQVQAITSATVTTNAIVDGVNMLIDVYNKELSN